MILYHQQQQQQHNVLHLRFCFFPLLFMFSAINVLLFCLVQANLYPTVGLQTPGEIVEANFGDTPFVYDIEDYMKVSCKLTASVADVMLFIFIHSVETRVRSFIKCDNLVFGMILNYVIRQIQWLRKCFCM